MCTRRIQPSAVCVLLDWLASAEERSKRLTGWPISRIVVVLIEVSACCWFSFQTPQRGLVANVAIKVPVPSSVLTCSVDIKYKGNFGTSSWRICEPSWPTAVAAVTAVGPCKTFKDYKYIHRPMHFYFLVFFTIVLPTCSLSNTVRWLLTDVRLTLWPITCLKIKGCKFTAQQCSLVICYYNAEIKKLYMKKPFKESVKLCYLRNQWQHGIIH